MLLKLYQSGQPILRVPAKKITKAALASKQTQLLIDAMIDTLRDAPGVGLAAPQVGESLRLIVIEDKVDYHERVPADVLRAQQRESVPLKVLVNPTLKILDKSRATYFEGCLSIEGYTAAVQRALRVKVEGLDRDGAPVSYVANGWHARILQHEIDHLDGQLYIDCMLSRSFMNSKNFNALWRKATEETIIRIFNEGIGHE